jgi:hypothetical protein
MRKPIVRAEWCRACPHFVVEKVGNRFFWRIPIVTHVVIAANLCMADFAQ